MTLQSLIASLHTTETSAVSFVDGISQCWLSAVEALCDVVRFVFGESDSWLEVMLCCFLMMMTAICWRQCLMLHGEVLCWRFQVFCCKRCWTVRFSSTAALYIRQFRSYNHFGSITAQCPNRFANKKRFGGSLFCIKKCHISWFYVVRCVKCWCYWSVNCCYQLLASIWSNRP